MSFESRALELFHHQRTHCAPYRRWVDALGVNVVNYNDIPFLPIELFKHSAVYCGATEAQVVFTSSGTTGAETSRHYVKEAAHYEATFASCFEQFYGSASQYSIFALLPSYMERQGSSLVYMVERLHAANPTCGGFYLYDFEQLALDLAAARRRGEKILLIGVTFALLDFAEQFSVDLSGEIVMETGGMKGRRREISRTELHETLCRGFNISEIHSEYGMTEMMSQCYSRGGGIFHAPPTVEVSFRSLTNPLRRVADGGGINIVDLGNVDSCAFIATGDYGHAHPSGGFCIDGRIEGTPLRGCNMLTDSI